MLVRKLILVTTMLAAIGGCSVLGRWGKNHCQCCQPYHSAGVYTPPIYLDGVEYGQPAPAMSEPEPASDSDASDSSEAKELPSPEPDTMEVNLPVQEPMPPVLPPVPQGDTLVPPPIESAPEQPQSVITHGI